MNARRHLAKVGRHVPRFSPIDPASSSRWFTGWRVALPVPDEPRPVAMPHTWLLACGWRRHGLLDPEEIPGAS
jgi:hypothetical protein